MLPGSIFSRSMCLTEKFFCFIGCGCLGVAAFLLALIVVSGPSALLRAGPLAWVGIPLVIGAVCVGGAKLSCRNRMTRRVQPCTVSRSMSDSVYVMKEKSNYPVEKRAA